MPACQKLLGDRVLREHPLVDLEFPQKDVAIDLMRGLLIVGEQLLHEQPGVGHIALEQFSPLQQRPSSYTQLARLSVHATYTNGTVSNLLSNSPVDCSMRLASLAAFARAARRAARFRTQGGPFRLETSLFARGVWGKGVSKREGPLEGIRLSSGNPMGAAGADRPPRRRRVGDCRLRGEGAGGPKPARRSWPARGGQARRPGQALTKPPSRT